MKPKHPISNSLFHFFLFLFFHQLSWIVLFFFFLFQRFKITRSLRPKEQFRADVPFNSKVPSVPLMEFLSLVASLSLRFDGRQLNLRGSFPHTKEQARLQYKSNKKVESLWSLYLCKIKIREFTRDLLKYSFQKILYL